MSNTFRNEEESAETPLLQQEEVQQQEDDEEEESLSSATTSPSCLTRIFKLMLSPLTDESGSGWGVLLGLLTLFIIGTCLGLALPKNETLPSPWYRAVSSCIGYTYFVSWSISFYPQVISNYTRKSTRGLSADFCGLNVIGFLCYTMYNVALFSFPTIQTEYRERHNGNDPTVQSNDVAFAIHALILSSVTVVQIGYYNRTIASILPSQPAIGYIQVGLVITIAGYALWVALHRDASWLDFLYLLSYLKIFISLIKYIPQVVLNHQRQSTQGWSIWNILLDLTGGLLSDLQLVWDCAQLHDWTGITGNFAKLGLGLISVAFDILFMTQHYLLYPKGNSYTTISVNVPNETQSQNEASMLEAGEDDEDETTTPS